MNVEAFDRVYLSFRAFHAEFAPDFGRKQWRANSEPYLQGLLVQAEERRNAENMAEALPISARALQRFLTDARWDDTTVIAHLQAYLAPKLAHAGAVWVVDGTGFPKQGTKSVGVAHQYCPPLGKTANCQVGVFLAYVSPRGRALVDKRLYLPESWTLDPARCEAAGVPPEHQVYHAQTDLALHMLAQAEAHGSLSAGWVTGDDTFGQSPAFRDAVAAGGWQYVLEVPGDTPVWPVAPTWVTPPYGGFGRPPKPRPVAAERVAVKERAEHLSTEAWHAVWVAEGAQGPRIYQFACERVRETRDRKPGKELWLLHRRNLDGSEPRYYFSNAPLETPLGTLARVAAARWPIETEFQTDKSDVGLDEYEVRSWWGWQHHITMCLLASAFLLSVQQEWGEKDAPHHAAPGVSHGARTVAAGALHAGRAAAVVGGDPTAQRTIAAVTC